MKDDGEVVNKSLRIAGSGFGNSGYYGPKALDEAQYWMIENIKLMTTKRHRKSGGSSRKQKNKRKTIRKKVSKTRKRTLNKKSKKRSKKLRK